MARKTIGLVIGGVLSCVAAAQADTIFFENFDGYTSFPDRHPSDTAVNSGLPTISEGADYDWYAGRFDDFDGGTIDSDTAIQRTGGNGDTTPVGRAEDEAGLIFHLDTTGYTQVTLDFEWRLFSPGSGDEFVAGYYVGDIDFTSDPPDGPNDNRVRDFVANGPTWANWVEIRRGDGTSWHQESFSLPSGESDIWFAFWLDNGNGDFAKIDNIVVSAIPEPASMMFLAFGGAALLRRKR